jgi:hypothetical protein
VPFPSLSSDNWLTWGAAGHIYGISANIVLKCPTILNNPVPGQIKMVEESIGKIEAEKAVYRVLMESPHPYILQCILCVPEGIFLRRMESTLAARLSCTQGAAIPPETQERWVWQLASALTWLERLGFVHGDLHPGNILLDGNEDIRVADFDTAVRLGDELQAASEPFCKMDKKFKTPLAGPVTEQFSFASCVYNIRFAQWPWHNLEERDRVQRMARNEFPPVSEDLLFGEVMMKAWHGEYGSMAAVEEDVLTRLGRTMAEGEALRLEALSKGDVQLYQTLRAECEEFIAKEALKARR